MAQQCAAMFFRHAGGFDDGFELGLCWAAEPNDDQAKAIAEIEKLGGKVTRDEEESG